MYENNMNMYPLTCGFLTFKALFTVFFKGLDIFLYLCTL